jgi:plastocyanin
VTSHRLTTFAGWASVLLGSFLLLVALPSISDARTPKRAGSACSFSPHAKTAKRSQAHAHCAKARSTIRAQRTAARFGPMLPTGAALGFAPAFPVAPTAAPGSSTTLVTAPTPSQEPVGSAPAVPAGSGRAVQVLGVEWALNPSRSVVAAGTVHVEYNLTGAEDGHDLVVERTDGTGSVYRFDEQQSRSVTSQDLSLSTGTWKLFCDLPGHARLGMQSTLTVR